MSCTIIECAEDHENFFWHIYESYGEVARIKALIRWKDLYKDSDTEHGIAMVVKCDKLLAEFRTRINKDL